MWVLILIGIVLVWVSGYLLITQKKGGNKNSKEQIIAVQSKVTDDDTRFRARKEEKAATDRTAARQAGNLEAQEIVNATVIQAVNVQAEFDLEKAPCRAEEKRALEKSLHDNQKALVEAATPLLLDPVALVE